MFRPAGGFNLFVHAYQRNSWKQLGEINIQGRNNFPARIQWNTRWDLHGNHQQCFWKHAAFNYRDTGGEINCDRTCA